MVTKNEKLEGALALGFPSIKACEEHQAWLDRQKSDRIEMVFERITKKNLDLTLEVAAEIFPYEVKNGKLSFEDDAYRASVKEGKPDFAYYLVSAYSGKTLKVVGITGHYREDDGKMWLGWFGVVPAWRGNGLGDRILKATADMVARLGGNEMLIYSGTRVEEQNAHRLYIRNGFKKTGMGKVNGEPVWFFRGPVPAKEIA